MIRIFSTENCPKCKMLKERIRLLCESYEEWNMATPDAMTELYTNGVFTISAPILQVDDKFYTTNDLFDGNNLKDLKKILG